MPLIRSRGYKRIFKTAFSICLLIGASLIWQMPSAAAQDLSAMSQRLERLERDIRTLHQLMARGGDVPKELPSQSAGDGTTAGDVSQNAVARIGVRLDALEGELRSTTGQMEELSFKMNKLSTDLEKMQGDLAFSMNTLRQYLQSDGQVPADAAANADPNALASPDDGGAQSSQSAQSVPVQMVGNGPQTLGTIDPAAVEALGANDGTAPATGVTQTGLGSATPQASPQATQPVTGQLVQAANQDLAALPTGSAEEQYKHAFGILRKHQFDQAEIAFSSFIEKNPDDALVSNARYWLGETHYARGEYVRAAEVFLTGFEADPEGAKAPDSLLKLGMSLAELGQTEQACGAIGKLMADFPSLSSAVKRSAVRQQRKLACQ